MDLVTTKDGREITTSLKVAEVFGKNHRDVLRALNNLDCTDKFRERNFALSSYISFTFLVMGFRGKQAAKRRNKGFI